MIRSISTKAAVFGALALGALGVTQAAHARSDVVLSIGFPGAVYAQPAPVYVQPAPVYVQPRPVYVQPRPVYYGPPAYVYDRRDWREHRHHRHDHRWDERRDHYRY